MLGIRLENNINLIGEPFEFNDLWKGIAMHDEQQYLLRAATRMLGGAKTTSTSVET